MKVEIDEAVFDDNQIVVLNEIIKAMDEGLKGIAPNRDKRKNLVSDLVFSIGAIIDNSAALQGRNGFITPVLTFAKEEDDFSVLISNGNTSFIHEYAHGFVEEFYENYGETDNE